jgi:hypothetical protein
MNEVEHESLKDLVLRHSKSGEVVFRIHDGLEAANLDEFIEQPTEGLLYDLNRDRVTVLSFIDDPKWVNDFAVALVIEKLKGNLGAAQAEIDRLRAALEAVEYVRGFCPWCGNSEMKVFDGGYLKRLEHHTATCQRQAALKQNGDEK